ncbi:MAG: energy transducer TonB [Sphingomonadales bacterium]|nr:energy transducer TonB [Sphingomonadales bacterium]MDE2168027.1 energy transducer TonB [Sphingomonadales bacterium]
MVLALCVQVVLAGLLLLGLSPAARQQVAQSALAAFSTPAQTAPPAPHPAPLPAPGPAATQGAAGIRVTPRTITAPVPIIPLTVAPAPQVAATGAADTSGMREDGAGPGAGAAGTGGGNGAGGAGQGGGGTPLAQIAGSIDSARDYPRAGSDARIGHSALIVFTVGADGRAHDCHVRESSGDPDSDAITCRLALERFRFRPATDANGQPVDHLYGWRQKWFY